MGPMTIAYRAKGEVYLNITNRCPSDCTFCLAKFTDRVYGYDLKLESDPPPEDILRELELVFQEGPAGKVSFVGLGEPTMRLDVVLKVTEWLKTRRIASRLVTNGHAQLLYPERNVAAELAAAGLKEASVSLVAHNSEVYNQLCRPMFSKAYRAVLKFAEACKEQGIMVTLTVIDLPEVDIEACRSIAEKMEVAFRVRPLITPQSEEVKA